MQTKSDRMETTLQLTKLFEEYMAIFMTQEKSDSKHEWYILWNTWMKKGITKATLDISTLASIIQFPGKYTSLKAIGQYMLVKLPVLS